VDGWVDPASDPWWGARWMDRSGSAVQPVIALTAVDAVGAKMTRLGLDSRYVRNHCTVLHSRGAWIDLVVHFCFPIALRWRKSRACW